MKSIGSILDKSGFGHRVSGAAEADQGTLTISQARENICEHCLRQGAKGWVRIPGIIGPDGIREMETTMACENRHQCQKLGQHFTDYVERIKKASGLTADMKTKTVNQFVATEPYQKLLKDTAVKFIANCKEKGATPWLLMSGQSGCGKTHLCSAVSNKLLADGKAVKYCDWLDLMRSVKSFDYRKLDECQNAAVLFLDDIYKRNPSPEESKATMELINHRYNHGLQTIVTSERTSKELLSIDEAVIGRIIEKCGTNWCTVGKDPERNFRMSGGNEI